MRWIAKILSLLVLLLLITLSLVATVPLRFIADHLPELPLPVQVNDARGTIVNGSATLLLQSLPFSPAINSKIKTLSVAWHWCPSFKVGLSAVCVEADTELAQGAFTTVLSPSATELYDVSLVGEIKRLPITMANYKTEISGDIQLSLLAVVVPFSMPFPSYIQGEIILQDVVANIFNLGNFNLDLSSNENEELSANITGNGELFSVQGIAGLNKDGQYRYNIDVQSEHTLVRNFLSRQGKANDKGGYRLAKTGALPMP